METALRKPDETIFKKIKIPNPFSPVQSALKFSTVLGTTSARSSITILPADWPPIDISKKTLGFVIFDIYFKN